MWVRSSHYNDVIMTTIASQITSLAVVYSTVYSDAHQRKHQSSASLAFVWGIHRDRWIPRTKGQLRGKCFHLMTSSWFCRTICPSVISRENTLNFHTLSLSNKSFCLFATFAIAVFHIAEYSYRQISYTGRTRSQNLHVSRLVLWSFLPNLLKLGVKSWMKM